MGRSTHTHPVVETPPLGPATREAERRIFEGAGPDELAVRLRQQAVLSDFGAFALTCRDHDALLQRACELCAEGLGTRLAKVLEWEPARDRLRVRAGIGWAAGVVGEATMAADMESPAGYAFRTGTPVISNHLTSETRFRTPQVLADHGVRRAMNVLISVDADRPYGVLEVDSSTEGRFETADLAFLQSFANLLGVAIERDLAEGRLAESQDVYQLTVEGVRDHAIFTVAEDGTVTGWNRGAEAVFGYPAIDIVGRPVRELFTPEDRSAGVPEEELRRARESGCAEDERIHLRKDGSRFWANGSVRPLRDVRGRMRGFVKVCRDETERRRAAEALRESEERFRLVCQATTDAVWDWDLVTDAITWSAALLTLTGERDVVPNIDWWKEHLHPDDRERVVGGLYAAIDGEAERWRDAYRFRRADGSYADVVDQGFVVRDADGRAVRMIGGMLDVSDRERVQAELNEAQERLEAALGAAEMGALDFDLTNGSLHLDDRCKILLGMPVETQMTYRLLLGCVDWDDRKAIKRAVRQAIDPAGTGDFYVELKIRPANEELRWIAGRGRVLVQPYRAPRIVGIAFDISNRKKIEQLMAEALEHQRMMASEVSHRVKNSLQLVAGMLALQARNARQKEVAEALTAAQNRVQTIGQVHDQLWRQTDVQEVELCGFLQSLCEKLEESSPGHRLSFHGEPTPMATDRAIPVALLVNELVTNAFKHAYPGEAGEVSVALEPEGERLRLEVSDRGVGLPSDLDLSEGARESLGMKVVSGLVRQLGAELELASNDPGARFVLRFDRRETAVDVT